MQVTINWSTAVELNEQMSPLDVSLFDQPDPAVVEQLAPARSRFCRELADSPLNNLTITAPCNVSVTCSSMAGNIYSMPLLRSVQAHEYLDHRRKRLSRNDRC